MRGLAVAVFSLLLCGCLSAPLAGADVPMCPESPASGWCHKSGDGLECADECVPSCMPSCPDCDDCRICAFCR
jgi:hypothetical protein